MFDPGRRAVSHDNQTQRLREVITCCKRLALNSLRTLPILACFFCCCSTTGEEGIRLTHEQQRKLGFDVSILNEEGLYGPPDGLRSLQYEFCIPAREEIVQELRAIDTTLQIHRNARGRIPCRPDQYLCVGHTHQANYLTVLSAIADLSYVERIEQAFFEE